MKAVSTLLVALCGCWAMAQEAVLYVGDAWDGIGAQVRPRWEAASFRQAQGGLKLSTVVYPETETAETKRIAESQKAINFTLDAYPGFAYFDAQGRCVLFRQGLKGDVDLGMLIAEGKQREKTIGALLAKQTADGAGEALALVVPELGLKRSREARGLKAAWDLLKAKDPKDATGWDFGLTFDPSSSCYRIHEWMGKGQRQAALDFIKDLESKPQTHLSTNQKQGLKLFTYLVYTLGNEKAPEKELALLKEVAAMDPTTHFGAAALGLLCSRGEGVIAIPYGWWPKDAAKGKQTWTIEAGVAKTLTEAGRYALTLKRDRGQGSMEVTLGKTTKTLNVGQSATIEFRTSRGADKLPISVTFSDPNNERGSLELKRILPVRKTVSPSTAKPWESASASVARYARQVIPEATFREIQEQEGGAKFLKDFFANTSWMEDFFGYGDPKGDWSTSLKALDRLVYELKPANATERKWCTAGALNVTDNLTEMVFLCQEMLKLVEEGYCIVSDKLGRVDQLRYVLIPAQLPAESVSWLAERHHIPPRDIGGACWYAPYRTYNFFNQTVQGPHYYTPWRHAYIRHQDSRVVGAVCGGLSYYGSAVAKIHGLPSTPGGQPGHCAYSVWRPDLERWEIDYNVNPYTGTHFQIWDGIWFYSGLEAMSEAYASPTHLTSMRALWQAEALREQLNANNLKTSTMTCRGYDWRGRNLPGDLNNLKQLGTWSGLTDFNLDQAGQRDFVLLVWDWTLSAETDTQVLFSLKSDDGSKLYLDGKEIAGKDGCHGHEGSDAVMTLSAGEHKLQLRYFNYNSGRSLTCVTQQLYAYNARIAEAYRKAAQISPVNYVAWRTLSNYLDESNAPLDAWQTFVQDVSTALKSHQQLGANLLHGQAFRALQRLGGQQAVVDALVTMNGTFRQGPQKTPEFFDYVALLNDEAKRVQKTDDLFRIFEAALKAQVGTPDAFGRLLKWGGSRFLKEEDSANRFLAALQSLLDSQGSGKNGLGRFVADAIREASQANNRQAFHALCDLQDSLNKTNRNEMNFGDVTGKLLSDQGLLTLSSASGQWDTPSAYRHVIDGRTPTQPFHTNEEAAPWAKIELPGLAEVSSVYIGNRPGNLWRLVPFTVEVSEDGKTWTKVAEESAVKDNYRFTFPAVRAKYVKVTAHPNGRTFLHLLKFCVFGKPLY